MNNKRIFLKGIDYFQLLIDHHIRKKGGSGHEARLVIYLKGLVEESLVRSTLANNSHCQQLSRARISNSFGLGYPSLYFTKGAEKIDVSFHHLNDTKIPESYFNITVDVYNKPPFNVQVFHFTNGNSAILFSFHHILFDFAGVESLIKSLSGHTDIQLLPAHNKPRPFTIRFKAFFKAVAFTFKEANSNMTIAEKKLPDESPLKITYKEIQFTPNETSKIYQKAAKSGVQLNRSVYFLAAVCKSMHDTIFSGQKKHRFIWIPVPVNFRRKGQPGAILFNGLSFLFYKLKPIELSDFRNTIETIRSQMKHQIMNKMPDAFLDFADGYRFMPMPFYYPMLNLPSWGKLSSFSFSVLGNTFKDFDEFMGLPVMDVKNYPSNSVSPGFTFLFYEFRGELKMMSCWVKNQYEEMEQEKMLSHLKQLLLDGSGES